MNKKEITINSNNLYKGKVIDLYVDDVKVENGTITKREVVKHRGGVCILAITDDDMVLVEKQYRYPYDEVVVELPAGKLEANENPLEAAKRELEEETGYICDNLISYGCIYPTCGYSNEIIHLYLAKDLKKGQVNLDFDENLEVIKMPLEEIERLILENKIVDAKTICLVSKYLLNNKNGNN